MTTRFELELRHVSCEPFRPNAGPVMVPVWGDQRIGTYRCPACGHQISLYKRRVKVQSDLTNTPLVGILSGGGQTR